MGLRVAVVTSDAKARLAAARALDAAPPDWAITLLHEAPERADFDVVVAGPDADVADAIAWRPEAPNELVEEITAAAGPSGRTIAVVGACGGAGATTLALHLAQALAVNASVCLVDVDGSCGAARRLGLAGNHAMLSDDVATAAVPVAGGFRALFAPCAGIEAVEAAARLFERVVVDAGRDVSGLSRPGWIGVLVLPPTVPAALGARGLLAAAPQASWAVVTNRLGPGGETTRAELERLLDRRIALELPCCALLRDAEDRGRLLGSPLSRYRRRVDRLARTLESL